MKYNSANHYLFLTFKGMLMGIADLVPGISGGTIALITGVYKDLITAISNINIKIFKESFSKNLSQTNSMYYFF